MAGWVQDRRCWCEWSTRLVRCRWLVLVPTLQCPSVSRSSPSSTLRASLSTPKTSTPPLKVFTLPFPARRTRRTQLKVLAHSTHRKQTACVELYASILLALRAMRALRLAGNHAWTQLLCTWIWSDGFGTVFLQMSRVLCLYCLLAHFSYRQFRSLEFRQQTFLSGRRFAICKWHYYAGFFYNGSSKASVRCLIYVCVSVCLSVLSSLLCSMWHTSTCFSRSDTRDELVLL